jgi:phosphoserine/homoserine phosphotransferase
LTLGAVFLHPAVPAEQLTIVLTGVELIMHIACLDLEGVLVPEVWIGLAERTGISELRATTRDIPIYDKLMRQRIRILEDQGLGIADIQAVVSEMSPLDGAVEFLQWLRSHFQVMIVSDTFYEIAMPLMQKLNYPTLICNKLIIDERGRVVDYKMRQNDQKRETVKALHTLNYRVVAAGDSYNDVTMLTEADSGILFCPPQNVIDEFPHFPVARSYSDLKAAIVASTQRFAAL